jgi:hypothetical protein
MIKDADVDSFIIPILERNFVSRKFHSYLQLCRASIHFRSRVQEKDCRGTLFLQTDLLIY